jgi:hypothetical protein
VLLGFSSNGGGGAENVLTNVVSGPFSLSLFTNPLISIQFLNKDFNF